MTDTTPPPAEPEPAPTPAVPEPPAATAPAATAPTAPVPPANPTPLWGILSICLAVVGLVLAFVFPYVAWVPAIAGLVLGIVGLTRKGAPKALPLTGTIASGVAWLASIVMTVVFLVGQAVAPGVQSVETQGGRAPITTPAPTTDPDAVTLDPNGYKVLSDHDYAVLVQDPAAAKGQKVLVYGQIFQKDKNTGKCAFLAATAGTQATMGEMTGGGVQEAWFNTADPKSCPILTDFAKGDYFVAEVQVFGTKKFTNTKHGHTIVPLYRVEAIELLPNP